MKNLAGDRDCDRIIAGELERARIKAVQLDQPSGEVHSRLRGQLGPVTFARGWIHWIASGPVPLAIAVDLYEHPLGRRDVRVAGNGTCPPPHAWAGWYTPDGARVYPAKDEAEYKRSRAQWPQVFASSGPIVFHDEPTVLGAYAYIDLYHIDSEEGLQLFAITLRRHGLEEVSRPAWWEQHHSRAANGGSEPRAYVLRVAQTALPNPEDIDTQDTVLDD